MQKIVKYIVYLMLFFGGIFSCAPAGEDDQKLTLFVAAGIAEPMERMADEFSKQNEVEVEIHFASSGTLVNQIKRGNNADVYISASKQWMGYAFENQLVSSSDVFHIAQTDLVLVGQTGFHFPFSRVSELSSDFDGHIAIGDPDYVPAGRYAVEALRSLEIYEDFREKLLTCKDVRSVLSMVETGECRYGIVYQALAMRSEKVEILTSFPSGSYGPVLFSGTIVKRTGRPELSRKFLEYATSYNYSRRILGMYGFARP